MRFTWGLNTTSKNTRAASNLLALLKNSSGLKLYDMEFEKWALTECGVKILHENSEYPSHISGLEIDDEAYTLLLLKYGPRVSFELE